MTAEVTQPRLALFFTSGMSLARWDALGMLAREVALYEQLQWRGVEVTFVTYGGADEDRYAPRLPGVQLCTNRFGLPLPIYERLLPLLHAPALRRAQLYKTNQIAGGAAALAAARLHGRPLIARCGYLWSEFMERRHGPAARQTEKSRATEWQVFSGADRVVVTTDAMRHSLLSRQPWLADRLHVVPNYVDTELFSPGSDAERQPNHLCYVGRLDDGQKNLLALTAAVRDLDVTLDLVGEGDLRAALEREAARNPRLRLLGGRPHAELPALLRRATAFVLPSHYEGHPKTLIEAMACGTPVITTDVPGISEFVTDEVNGALCSPDADSLRRRIQDVLARPTLRSRLSTAARAFALERYALESIAEQERALYCDLVAEGRTQC